MPIKMIRNVGKKNETKNNNKLNFELSKKYITLLTAMDTRSLI